MKFQVKAPYIFVLFFCLISCKEEDLFQDDYLLYNENAAMVNLHYKKAVNNRDKPIKAIKYIDSALIKSKAIDSFYIKCLAYKSYLLYKNKEYDKAISYSDSLLQKAQSLKDTLYIAKAYYKKGIYNSKLFNTVKAFKNYTLSKKYFLHLNDSNQVAGKLLNMSNIQKNVGDYAAAKETVIEGFKFQTNNSTKQHISNLYNVLSIVKKEEKEYVKSLVYKEKAIQLFRNKKSKLSAKDSISLVRLLNSKAVIYSKKGEYSKALEILEGLYSFPVINLKESIGVKALVMDNLGVVKGKLKDSTAEGALHLSYRIRDSLQNRTGLNASYIHLCEFYIDENKPKEALYWAKLGYENAKKIKSLVAQKEALHYITYLQTPIEKEYIEAYKKVSDSMVILASQVKKIYAEEEYEAHQNKLLALQKENEAAEERFLKKTYLITGVVLILMLILYKYFSDRYKLEKHKKQQLVTVYDTETRISKRVHDELANDVYRVMTRLQADENLGHIKKRDHLMDTLENIYNKSRDISRETNTVDVLNFTEELKNMFSSFSTTNTNVISKGLEDNIWKSVPNHKRVVVYRVLQELMTNMKKHSQASFTIINFSRINNKIKINYSDNGVGVNMNTKKIKNGLKNAENRIESIDGVFIFESEQDKGVKVKIRFSI